MMSHGLEAPAVGAGPHDPTAHPLLARAALALRALNGWIMVTCMGAVVLAAGILSYSVAARYFFKIPTEWQDETAIFLLIGATFFSGAYVQSQRGHIGVEAIAGLLSPRLNRIRMFFVEAISLMFVAFFAWKSWVLFLDALHEGHTSNSTWGPPMWIPYSLMALGMTLLALQLALEFVSRVVVRVDRGARP